MKQSAIHPVSPFPSVEAPSRVEEAALAGRGERLRDALEATLHRWCARSCLVHYEGYALYMKADEIPGGEDAACAVLRCGGLSWRLVMCRRQARVLAAHVLGLAPSQNSGGLTAVEWAIFADVADELARSVADMNAVADYSASVPAAALPPPALPSIGFSYVAALAQDETVFTLLTSRHDLRSTSAACAGREEVIDRAALHTATVEVAAHLATVQVPLSEVLGLRCGDVIRLGPIGADAYLSIGGCRIAAGRAGCQNGRMAVNIRDCNSREK